MRIRGPRESALGLTVWAVASLCGSIGLLGSIGAADENWANWRGPQSTGVTVGSFPVEWSANENLAWKLPMPSHAGATPIVWEDNVVVTAAEAGKNVVYCVSLETGEVRWKQSVGQEREGKHRKASGSNSSPVTDGQRIFVYFKSGDLAALDFTGEIKWQRNLQEDFGEDTLWWDLGTSPVLTADHLVIACVQSGPSYLAAFDLETGELAWKVDRMLDAPEEANQTYSTPLVIDHDNGQMLVVLGADHVTAHRADNGEELWRIGGMNPQQDKYFRSIASPVYIDETIIAPYARGTTLTAISLDGKVKWQDDDISADVPTPAAKNGMVYVCSDKGRLVCLSSQTGAPRWEVATPKNRSSFSASPILAGDHLYLTREDSTVFVFRASDNHELLATNKLAGMTVATPVFVQGRILIRTSEQLYCIKAEG